MYFSFSGGEKTTIRDGLMDFYRSNREVHNIEFIIYNPESILWPRIEEIIEIYSIAKFLPELEFENDRLKEARMSKVKKESAIPPNLKINWKGTLEQLAKLIYKLNEKGWIEDLYNRKDNLQSKASALLNCFEPNPVNNKASSPGMRLRSLAANLKESKIKIDLNKNIEFDGILKKSEITNSRRSLKSK